MEEDDTCKVLIEAYDAHVDDSAAAAADADESSFIYMLNLVLGGTARLNVLLPTATILAFTIFAPLVTDDGRCDALGRWLMSFFVAACAASCVFFTFTDSFRAPSGRLCYGVATLGGIWTFGGRRRGIMKGTGRDPPPETRAAYRLRGWDAVHATLSLVAFATFAASHADVTGCYEVEVPRKVSNTAPVAVGFVVSLVFVVFPSRRRGVGYPFLLHNDAVYLKELC